ncbi:HNH endonuclease family protein [Streptomyces sp. NPDC048248]|uniref:HNH endonuclease family protein n=1 Tax=Streptomyces sp. NPDC048248 TaxID=3365523 RepID=UPI00371EF990
MRPARRLTALACPLLLLTVAACSGDASRNDDPKQPSATAPAASPPADAGLRLSDAIEQLKVAEESRTGYERDKFHLWIDADHDGCDTRKEVLLTEALTKPRQGASCKLIGGTWRSYYDGKTVTEASRLDIDHLVPLAEAWDSGASKWTDERREKYANDLDAQRSLVAVSSGPNRSKGDQDPAEWMPPAKDASCTYTTDWVTAKLRWKLTIDPAEGKVLAKLAASCTEATVKFTPAP